MAAMQHVGEMAGDRRDSVVGVQEHFVFRCAEIQVLLRGGQREIQRGRNLLSSVIADRWERELWCVASNAWQMLLSGWNKRS